MTRDVSDVVTRPVLMAAWEASQRRAGVTGLLNLSPPAQAGSMIDRASVEDALTDARKAVAYWTEVLTELEAVERHEAKGR